MEIIHTSTVRSYRPTLFHNVPNRSVFVDVGMWKGDTLLSTINRFRELGTKLICLGIDPVPINVKHATDALRGQDNVYLIEKGCWFERGLGKIKSDPANIDNATHLLHLKHLAGGDEYHIFYDTLDNILDGYRIPSVDLIKIDTEGAEKQVLMGFSKYKPGTQFHIECHQGNTDDVLEQLEKMGVKSVYMGGRYQGSGILGEF